MAESAKGGELMNQRSPTDIALERHLSPVNKTAAMVVAKGVHWEPMKKIQEVDSINPPQFIAVRNLSSVKVGMRAGSLTVIGMIPGKSHKDKGPLFACRCDCGWYTQRRGRALRNSNNNKDACGTCQQKAYLKRKMEYSTFGRNRD